MKISRTIVTATAVAMTLAIGACSPSDDDGGGGSSGEAIKVGVLTSLSGPAASGFTSVEQGVKARLALANKDGGVNGHRVDYVMEDDASTPAGAKAATERAINRDKVFGLLSISTAFYAAYEETVKQQVPVVGLGFDGGPQWLDEKNTNLFDTMGAMDYSKVSTTLGKAAKEVGATKLTSVGYSESPSAAQAAKAAIASAKAAGLEEGPYQAVSMGSTDVGPTVLAIKNSGADALFLPVIPSTGFAIVAGLAQAGVKMKMIVMSTGYGGDLLGSPQAVAAGNGAYFASALTPVEADTEGTKKFQAALKEYVGYEGIPSFGHYAGWQAADAFLFGLSKSGDNPTRESFIEKARGQEWDNGGLGKPMAFGKPAGVAGSMGIGNCIYLPRLDDGKFVLQPESLNPVCGEIIPDVTVSP